MKRWQLALCLLLCLPLLFSCGTASEYEKQSFFAMDTFCEVRLYSEADNATALFAEAKTLIDTVENAISVTREGGDTFRFNASEQGIADASETLVALIGISEEISRLTDGAFDIRTGALISLWQRCEEQGRLPTENELSAAVSFTDGALEAKGTSISKSNAALTLNFGAIGKGYAADVLKEQLVSAGVHCGMISFVSSVTVFGERPEGEFRIAIRRPDTSGELAGTVTLQNESLSVSGNYERYYEIDGERYDHILDPATGHPADQGIDSVVVVTESGALADALSTAITVMEPQKTLALYQSGEISFEAAVFCGREILVTDGFAKQFSTADDSYTVVLLSERY